MRFQKQIFISVLFIVSSFFISIFAETKAKDGSPALLDELPLAFIQNQGQMEEPVLYYLKGRDKTVLFSEEGITFILRGDNENEGQGWVLKCRFLYARSGVIPEGEDRQDTSFSYFKGNPDQWKTGIRTFSKIVYRNLWPGIDLEYTGERGRMKYTYQVSSGANPENIQFEYEGTTEIKVNEQGELILSTPFGEIVDERPYAFQEIHGQKREVTMDYNIDELSTGEINLSYTIGSYDAKYSLILDPAMLLYCGFINGLEDDYGYGIAVDHYGNAYIVGVTRSDESFFPVHAGPDLLFNGESDAFVAKVNAAGTHLEYCGYIGGTDNDCAYGIDVDDQGNAYVVGDTRSTEGDGFPVKRGPDLTYNGGETDVFVAKINVLGTDLEYCGYIGGDQKECDYSKADIAVTRSGNAIVVGNTMSNEDSFPVFSGPDLTYGGDRDAFIAMVSPSGKNLEFCGYIGGKYMETGECIALDKDENIYMGGVTYTDRLHGFPVKIGPDLTQNGDMDGYVVKLDKRGKDIVYCGYIGGIEKDSCNDIAVRDGCAYLAGQTKSNELSFPVVMGPDLTMGSNYSGFVAKVSETGDSLVYCGYVGGNQPSGCKGIGVDPLGNTYVTGETGIDWSFQAFNVDPKLTKILTVAGPFIAKVNPDGLGYGYLGFLNGEDPDFPEAVAVDDIGNAYLLGATYSQHTSFPVQIGPYLKHSRNWATDVYVARIVERGLYCNAYTLPKTGGRVYFTLDAGPENKGRHYILLGALNSVNPGFGLPGKQHCLPFNVDFFTKMLIMYYNTPMLTDFLGTLDPTGCGEARIISDSIRPEFVGLTIYFAYCLYNPFDFVSNPVPIEITW